MSLLHSERLVGVRQELVDFVHDLASAAPFDVLVVFGKRTDEQQCALYAQGRTAPGPHAGEPGRPALGLTVTNAEHACDTAHGRACAVDIVPVVGGVALWDDHEKFLFAGELAEAHGLVWGGRWKMADLGHVELRDWREITLT